jgi:hypothetical protein
MIGKASEAAGSMFWQEALNSFRSELSSFTTFSECALVLGAMGRRNDYVFFRESEHVVSGMMC